MVAHESILALRFSRCRLTSPANVLGSILVLASGSLQPFNYSIVPAANAFVQTRVCLNASSRTIFRPYVQKPQSFTSCEEDLKRGRRYEPNIRPRCLVPGTSIYAPCPKVHAVPLSPGRFCGRWPTPKDLIRVEAEELRSVVDLPHIIVDMPEAGVHPTNINHFTRDLLFIVSMARQAHMLGGAYL